MFGDVWNRPEMALEDFLCQNDHLQVFLQLAGFPYEQVGFFLKKKNKSFMVKHGKDSSNKRLKLWQNISWNNQLFGLWGNHFFTQENLWRFVHFNLNTAFCLIALNMFDDLKQYRFFLTTVCKLRTGTGYRVQTRSNYLKGHFTET